MKIPKIAASTIAFFIVALFMVSVFAGAMNTVHLGVHGQKNIRETGQKQGVGDPFKLMTPNEGEYTTGESRASFCMKIQRYQPQYWTVVSPLYHVRYLYLGNSYFNDYLNQWIHQYINIDQNWSLTGPGTPSSSNDNWYPNLDSSWYPTPGSIVSGHGWDTYAGLWMQDLTQQDLKLFYSDMPWSRVFFNVPKGMTFETYYLDGDQNQKRYRFDLDQKYGCTGWVVRTILTHGAAVGVGVIGSPSILQQVNMMTGYSKEIKNQEKNMKQVVYSMSLSQFKISSYTRRLSSCGDYTGYASQPNSGLFLLSRHGNVRYNDMLSGVNTTIGIRNGLVYETSDVTNKFRFKHVTSNYDGWTLGSWEEEGMDLSQTLQLDYSGYSSYFKPGYDIKDFDPREYWPGVHQSGSYELRMIRGYRGYSTPEYYWWNETSGSLDNHVPAFPITWQRNYRTTDTTHLTNGAYVIIHGYIGNYTYDLEYGLKEFENPLIDPFGSCPVEGNVTLTLKWYNETADEWQLIPDFNTTTFQVSNHNISWRYWVPSEWCFTTYHGGTSSVSILIPTYFLKWLLVEECGLDEVDIKANAVFTVNDPGDNEWECPFLDLDRFEIIESIYRTVSYSRQTIEYVQQTVNDPYPWEMTNEDWEELV